MTPTEVAEMLGISPKTLRAWLRVKYGKYHLWNSRWYLTPVMVEAARIRFS